LLDWGGGAANRLADHALALANANTKTVRGGDLQWGIQAWVNVFGKGAGNAAHIHGGNFWAAVYYVKIGEGEGGRLRLHDPRAPALRMHAPLLRFTNAGRELMQPIEPVPGQMVLFPAWLMHSVEPWDGDGDRISIAMNIRSAPKRRKKPASE
ncbi:MAG: 2OG-Fe(II) oxygenase family protein, partial [Pseudomonadota bacterium]|nr:2OG-Fe(II) oxygenase family protein [Pseudomonadota bacterium]